MEAATEEVATDLTDYLALGCLCLVYVSDGSSTKDPDALEWQEVDLEFFNSLHPSSTATNLIRLLNGGWIRLQVRRCVERPSGIILRVYALYHDLGHLRIKVDRNNSSMVAALEAVVREVDINPLTWKGSYVPDRELRFDMYATRDGDDPSLYWLFNTLPSPSPAEQLKDIADTYAREALEDILDESSTLPGLKTDLFPYQRRSAGAMLCREAAIRHVIDPRLEQRVAPDGSSFYFSARDFHFLKDPFTLEACRGGILAETMGLGKTVICLSLLLATRHHLPRVPVLYAAPPVRQAVASLADMAISAVNRHSLPWKVEFERIRQSTGDDMASCMSKLQASPPFYDIPPSRSRWERTELTPSPQRMLLTSATLIVVPRNLCSQWQSEIIKHVDADALNVLVMDDLKKPLPAAEVLCKYDVVLFARNRFDLESRHGTDSFGRRMTRTPLICTCPYIGATRTRRCTCLKESMLYASPLQHLHFKRLIVDEGHSFSQVNTNAVLVATQLVTADSRWLVSGTPARDLLGVEVDLSTEDGESLLQQRRHFDPIYDRSGAIDALGSIASSFLKIQPWAPDASRQSASFKEHVYRHEDSRRLTFSGFSRCFRKTLESMVIKTQPGDVEITLPPLRHDIVRLTPTAYDKLTANLFTLVLTANAITSERTDADYLFHKNSHKERMALVSNVRQSSFFWSGFDEADIQATATTSRRYLEKEEINCAKEDRQLLLKTLELAETPALQSEGWKAMSRCHELGVVVQDWPAETASHWSFEQSADTSRILTGISQLLDAQRFVNTRINQSDPGEGLAGVGIKALAPARWRPPVKKSDVAEKAAKTPDSESTDKTSQAAARLKRRRKSSGGHGTAEKAKKSRMTKSGVPISSLGNEPVLKRRRLLNSNGPRSTGTISRTITKKRQDNETSDDKTGTGGCLRSLGQALQDETTEPRLPADSTYARSRIIGTSSAKMSYLISRILKYHQDEKILVFYSGDHIAFYVAQMLELLNIKHDIYARSLSKNLQSEYVVRFNETPDVRVLLMDIKCGAHGLNLCAASRIYFVNPVCRPSVEAQAIKRAHRIGQTREVKVETLILAGTIEEEMLLRAQRMTNAEHIAAKTLEDDGGIRKIIQNARCLPLTKEDLEGTGAMAALEIPEQLWSRPGWSTGTSTPRTMDDHSTFAKNSASYQTDGREENGPKPQAIGQTKQARFGPVVLVEADTTTNAFRAQAPAREDNALVAC